MTVEVPEDTVKECSKCWQYKSLSEFSKDDRCRLGVRTWCKECCNEHARDTYDPDRTRANKLWSKYRLRPVDYASLLAEQGGGCAICGEGDEAGRDLAVDHDHNCCPGDTSCGKCVRGLLCGRCNRAIGQFQDNLQRVRAAVVYLESYERAKLQ